MPVAHFKIQWKAGHVLEQFLIDRDIFSYSKSSLTYVLF